MTDAKVPGKTPVKLSSLSLSLSSSPACFLAASYVDRDTSQSFYSLLCAVCWPAFGFERTLGVRLAAGVLSGRLGCFCAKSQRCFFFVVTQGQPERRFPGSLRDVFRQLRRQLVALPSTQMPRCRRSHPFPPVSASRRTERVRHLVCYLHPTRTEGVRRTRDVLGTDCGTCTVLPAV